MYAGSVLETELSLAKVCFFGPPCIIYEGIWKPHFMSSIDIPSYFLFPWFLISCSLCVFVMCIVPKDTIEHDRKKIPCIKRINEMLSLEAHINLSDNCIGTNDVLVGLF